MFTYNLNKKTTGSTTGPQHKKSLANKAVPNQSTPKFLQRKPDRVESSAHHNLVIQAKLSVGEPNDEYEQEADEVADQVMRNSESENVANTSLLDESNTPLYLQRMPETGQNNELTDDHNDLVQAKAKTTKADRVESSTSTLPSSPAGKPVTSHVRDRVEPVLGTSLGQVRVHDNAQAQVAASSINARAFTHQSDVFLGAGESENDVQLLAHESTHVVQQGLANTPSLQRATKRRETRPTPATRSDIEKEVGKSYWEAKVGELFRLVYITPVTTRFSTNKEERDAVLSVLWQNKPVSKLKKSKTSLHSIAARSGVKGAKDLIYQFVFKPKTKKKKASVEIQLIAEGSTAKVAAASVPKSSFTPSSFALTHMGFPKNNMDAYFKANPDEHKQLYNWLENLAPNKFDQVITTAVTKSSRRGTTTRNASFKVKGSKSTSSGMSGLVIHYLGALVPVTGTPGAGYDDKNYVDLELEQLQSRKKNKLGAITGLGSLPKDEVSSVKYTIWQYFEFGKVGQSELDVIIPIANSKRSVFYTLRFDVKTNDVEVERIGEAGKGKAKPDELDISRVNDFSNQIKDAATFKSWLTRRYPGVSVSGKTVAELQTSINKSLKSDSGKPDWFRKNYGIEILDASKANTRMDTVHGWPVGRRTGIKDFTSSELVKLEMTLQSMSLAVLKHLKSLRLVRQDSYLKKKKRVYVAVPRTYGYTFNKGSDTTVVMFDSFVLSDQNLFAGGKEGVRSASTANIAHELGHAADYKAGLAAKFNAFVKARGINAMSWYAATGKSEEFPEAFAFYHTDPEWMRVNFPDMFKWFETLSKTGKPPP